MTSISENTSKYGKGYTVNVCCIHRHAGQFNYPGVILEILPVAGLSGEGRARVQVWKDHLNYGAGGWDTYTVDLCCLELADHEIGACLDCGCYDWYARFDDDCRCAVCQPETEAEPDDEDSAAIFWADVYEDDWKLARR